MLNQKRYFLDKPRNNNFPWKCLLNSVAFFVETYFIMFIDRIYIDKICKKKNHNVCTVCVRVGGWVYYLNVWKQHFGIVTFCKLGYTAPYYSKFILIRWDYRNK